MNSSLLRYSLFQNVFFPPDAATQSVDEESAQLQLRRVYSFRPMPQSLLSSHTLVVFDFETTGLDTGRDRIIEIGAQKWVNGQIVEEFDTLVDPERSVGPEIMRICGINDAMLVGQPKIEDVLPRFLSFIKGSLLVAHNAAFDMAFLRNACSRMGIDLDWPSFCTLKLARELLPQLERKALDTLAEHYGLEFEARHRSLGDVKVTAEIMQRLLCTEGKHIKTWEHLAPYYV